MNSSATPAAAVVQPLPPRFTPYEPTAIVPLPAVAARFGYACTKYFRTQVAGRLGITFIRRSGRYFVLGEVLNAAIQRFLEGMAS